MNITSPNILNYLIITLAMIIGVPLFGTIIPKLILYFSNTIRFGNQKLTDEEKLVNFAKSISGNFKNRYSLRYYQDNEVWHMIRLQDEIKESEYSCLVEKKELVKQTKYLFQKYYQDLNNKDFININSYFPTFVRCRKYQQNFVKRTIYNPTTVFYNPKIIGIAITSFDLEENIFKIQINAETKGFIISKKGYVLRGKPDIQQYSKYWNITLVDNDYYLIREIDNTVSTKMLKQDIEAKLEFFSTIT